VLWVPLVANVPVQPPDAVQAVASVELQVSVAAPPLVMLVVETASAAVGVLAGATSTVTDLVSVVPPDPVHSSEYVVFWVSKPVLCVPLVATAPDQPPEAVHAVAFVELQLNVVEPPLVKFVEAALIETVGASEIPAPPPPPQAARKQIATTMNKECFMESLLLMSVE
jgi:hypothetical protein